MTDNEEVLGRLNALLNRDKQAASVEAPPSVPESAVTEPSARAVPLLTDIYLPVATNMAEAVDVAATKTTAGLPAGHLLESVIPMARKVVEEVLTSYVKSAVDEAVNRALVEMQPRLDALLRQHLSETLMQMQQGKT